MQSYRRTYLGPRTAGRLVYSSQSCIFSHFFTQCTYKQKSKKISQIVPYCTYVHRPCSAFFPCDRMSRSIHQSSLSLSLSVSPASVISSIRKGTDRERIGKTELSLSLLPFFLARDINKAAQIMSGGCYDLQNAKYTI